MSVGLWMDRCHLITLFFFFNDTATTEIYTLSLHDALPISETQRKNRNTDAIRPKRALPYISAKAFLCALCASRSEEHTSELQSLRHLVCRLLLEKKTKTSSTTRRGVSRTLGSSRSSKSKHQ